MKLVKMKCPECNAPLDVDMDNLIAFCPHCGTKLFFDFDEVGQVFVEKEKLKQEKEKTRRKDLKYKHEEKINLSNNFFSHFSDDISFLIAFVPLLLILASGFVYQCYSNWQAKKQVEEKYDAGYVKSSLSSDELNDTDYESAKTALESSGFSNVVLEPMEDLKLGLFAKEGDVETVTINGDDDFEVSEWFPSDAKVVIKYHSYKEKD